LAEVAEPKQELSIAAQSPEDISEYLATMQKKSFTDMSDIELDDMRIPCEYAF
jgi:protein CMS1